MTPFETPGMATRVKGGASRLARVVIILLILLGEQTHALGGSTFRKEMSRFTFKH